MLLLYIPEGMVVWLSDAANQKHAWEGHLSHKPCDLSFIPRTHVLVVSVAVTGYP